MASGTISSLASTVVITQGTSVATLHPSGSVSIGTGFCPGGACPLTIEGVQVNLPDFTLNGANVTGPFLQSMGSWDGEKLADETYLLYGTTVLSTWANVNAVLQTGLGRSGVNEINGVVRMIPGPLPAPLTGTGRYATVSGLFTLTGMPGGTITLEVNVVAPLTAGGPTISVATIAQPACGTAPCGGTTYDASGSRTFGGTTAVSFQWVDQLNRIVGTGATLTSQAVTNVAGSPSPWPVRLIARDETTGANDKPRTRQLIGPGTPPRGGQFYVQADFGTTLTRGFLNRGEYEDIVVGTPHDATATGANMFGAVNVVFGGRPDARYGRDFRWTLPAGTASDRFGTAAVVGDFNGDGREDLAASAPGRLTSGAVYVAYQDLSSLSTVAPSGAVSEIKGSDAPSWLGGTGFGTALASGDFNGDGADDLAVGVPSYNASRGAIWVYYVLMPTI